MTLGIYVYTFSSPGLSFLVCRTEKSILSYYLCSSRSPSGIPRGLIHLHPVCVHNENHSFFPLAHDRTEMVKGIENSNSWSTVISSHVWAEIQCSCLSLPAQILFPACSATLCPPLYSPAAGVEQELPVQVKEWPCPSPLDLSTTVAAIPLIARQICKCSMKDRIICPRGRL